MATIRTYSTVQVPETINSDPIPYAAPSVNIAIVPNAEIVSVTTNYGSYTYNNEPVMYYHDAGEPLTFTGSIIAYTTFNVVEWYWDFGDGTNGAGNPIVHTYAFGGEDVIVHLRVSDDQGRQAWGSINPMLRATGDGFVVAGGVIYV